MRVLGNDVTFKVLRRSLPPVSLFVGPWSVGKHTMADTLLRAHMTSGSDVLRVKRLTAESAKDVVSFAHTAPMGLMKVAIIDLKHSTTGAVNVLLKTLEESPTTFRAILIAETLPAPVVASRARVFYFRTLSMKHMEQIYTERFKMKPSEATVAASRAGGQVMVGYESLKGYDSKNIVLLALKAFREHDPEQLDRLADRWTDDATDLLTIWCREQITGQWHVFNDAEAEMSGKSLALKILMSLRENLRPRLIVRSSLMKVLRGA